MCREDKIMCGIAMFLAINLTAIVGAIWYYVVKEPVYPLELCKEIRVSLDGFGDGAHVDDN